MDRPFMARSPGRSTVSLSYADRQPWGMCQRKLAALVLQSQAEVGADDNAASPDRTNARLMPGTRIAASRNISSRVARGPNGSEWQVEVRCVVAEGRRAVDIARTVHDRARASLLPLVTAHETGKDLTVTVTITRIMRTPA
ncbi:hypothetical protein [Streptomyces sp. NPDC026673]|uniref:hypothetical protein n=1 Tax=Streptomyces sp. NPDC026673 TaxID=3155724 RepID=UPI0033DAAC46